MLIYIYAHVKDEIIHTKKEMPAGKYFSLLFELLYVYIYEYKWDNNT